MDDSMFTLLTGQLTFQVTKAALVQHYLQNIISLAFGKEILMRHVRKKLPHLDPLIAFEAAARLSSFALAARELNVTAPAVSQQIRSLETGLGVSLFQRGHRSVHLTDRGKLFQNSVSIALTHLANAADEVRIDDDFQQLEIVTDTSIAGMWLVPHLHRFEARHPDCTIRLTTTDVQADLISSDFQIAIVHGQGNWAGYESILLFEEEVFPVCAPGYLDRFAAGLKLEELPVADLLDLEYEQWHWMNWAIWLTETGLPLPDTRRKMKMNNYPLVIDAACNGSGLALGWRHLVDDHLANGTLVQPFSETVKTQSGYYMIWPFNTEMAPIAAAFRDWTLAEFDVDNTVLRSAR
jgi:DNA-binding transcriptional LysR family regulator